MDPQAIALTLHDLTCTSRACGHTPTQKLLSEAEDVTKVWESSRKNHARMVWQNVALRIIHAESDTHARMILHESICHVIRQGAPCSRGEEHLNVKGVKLIHQMRN